MRFRAFKKRVWHTGWIYAKVGCEIETWGGSDAHFKSASIDSWYGELYGGDACYLLKVDCDFDTNDDYVDEYEWRIPNYPADGVRSYCYANWRNMEKGGAVYKTCQYYI